MPFEPMPQDVLNGVSTDYYDAQPVGLMDRWQPMTDWADARLAAKLEPYCKVNVGRIGPRVLGRDRAGRGLSGINMASQDYLSLGSHPKLLAAAAAAARRFGVHSAGSPAQMGLTTLATSLEERIAEFLSLADATVFSTGWGAGYGAIRTLVREGDHVLIDVLANACLHEAASASGALVHRFSHCSTEAVAARLDWLRENEPFAGILVVTEGVFSMNSDMPDLAALQAICRRHDATLCVDVAHDLGVMGETGRGVIEMQGMTGQIDVVMGSFSKAFASNGGFVASNHPALKLALRYACSTHTLTNALSPVQAAVVLAALDIVESAEGAERRARLMDNSLRLRDGLTKGGFQVLGQPSAIVPVGLGRHSRARRLTADVLAHGALVNLVEHPVVPRNGCRWQLQIMADHSADDIDAFVAIAEAARMQMEPYSLIEAAS